MSKIFTIPVQPIGMVRNQLGRRSHDKWKNTTSQIIIDPAFQDALYKLDEYSHIEVIFQLHEMNQSFQTRIHPTGNPNLPLMGAFATRTPNRPSRIALTTCKLLNIEQNTLTVQDLDAYNNSPVIDIKPVTNCPKTIKTPEWLTK